MAVPTSGALSMVKIARERKYSDYNGSQTMGTISMRDLMEGGNAGGSTISYPAVNDGACNDDTLPFTAVAVSTLLKVNNEEDTCGTGCILRAYIYNSSGTDISSSVYVSPSIHPNDIYPIESDGNLLAATFYSNSAGTSFIANGSYSVDIVRTNCGTANCNNCTLADGCAGGCQSFNVTITNGKWTAYPQGGC